MKAAWCTNQAHVLSAGKLHGHKLFNCYVYTSFRKIINMYESKRPPIKIGPLCLNSSKKMQLHSHCLQALSLVLIKLSTWIPHNETFAVCLQHTYTLYISERALLSLCVHDILNRKMKSMQLMKEKCNKRKMKEKE